MPSQSATPRAKWPPKLQNDLEDNDFPETPCRVRTLFLQLSDVGYLSEIESNHIESDLGVSSV